MEFSDQVLIRAHVVFVNWARIHGLLILSLTCLGCAGALVLLSSGAVGVHLDVGESIVEVFALGVFEVALTLVPSSTFQVETMDPDSIAGFLDRLAFDTGIVSDDGVPGVSNISTLFDGIEGPVVDSVSSGDFLTHGGEETLWVEEASEPEGDWALSGAHSEPPLELVVPVVQRR